MSRAGAAARRVLPAILGIAISAGLLAWTLRGVDLSEVGARLRGAHPLPLVLASIVATLTFPLRVVRWRLLLRREDGTPYQAVPLWHAVAIGFMANNLLPFRAGELVRTFAATRLAHAPFGAVLSSIAVERIFDGLAVVALLSLGLFASHLPPGVEVRGVSVAHAAQITGALGGAALIMAILVVAFPRVAEGVIRRLLPAGRFTDKLVGMIEGIRVGLAALRSPPLLFGVAFWSLAIWIVNAAAFWLAFFAFDIPVDFAGALVLQGVAVVMISVPGAPGFVGQLEAGIVAALALYGVPKDLALSYATAYHATTFLPIVLLGFWSLARSPVAIGDLRRSTA